MKRRILHQPPAVVPNFDDELTGVVKVVGVSEDYPRVAACEAAVQRAFGTQVFAARSQPHYLDVTHPTANKGVVIERLSRYLKNPASRRVAALGDQLNDVPMFERAGVSIAMDNASDEVKRQATFVTTSFADEGFANAVERFILPRAEPRQGLAVKGDRAAPSSRAKPTWLDNITRDLLPGPARFLSATSKELSVTGLTSNPSLFERAIKKSSAYDATIRELSRRGSTFGEENLLRARARRSPRGPRTSFDPSTSARRAWTVGSRWKYRRYSRTTPVGTIAAAKDASSRGQPART